MADSETLWRRDKAWSLLCPGVGLRSKFPWEQKVGAVDTVEHSVHVSLCMSQPPDYGPVAMPGT